MGATAYGWRRRLSDPDDGLATEGRHPARQLLAQNLRGAPSPEALAEPAASNPFRIAVSPGQTVDLTGYALDDAVVTFRGGDIVLTSPDGQVVVLVGFVDAAVSGAPPMLLLAGGVDVSGLAFLRAATETDEPSPGEVRPETPGNDSAAPNAPDGDPQGAHGDLGGPSGLTVTAGSPQGSSEGLPPVASFAMRSDPPATSPQITPAPFAANDADANVVLTLSSDPPPTISTPGQATDITFGDTTAVNTVLDTDTVLPFAGVTVAYPMVATVLNITVTLSNAADGVFTAGSLAASGFADAGGGAYTFAGTAAAVETAIRQLAFDPTDNIVALGGSGTTTFTLAGDDGGTGTGNDSTTTAVATRATGTAAVDTVTLPIALSSGTVDLQGSNDTLTLADGGNTLIVSNVETVNGGSGTDIVSLGTIGTVTITAVESLTGTVGDDTINVSQVNFAVMTALDGGLGNDTLAFSDGGSFDLSALTTFTAIEFVTTTGASTLTLPDGVNLTVTLDNASNTVTGGSGSDSIVGSNGADTLAGGAGQDQLNGGGGADRFVFTVADSQNVIGLADVVTGFQDNTDIIAISGVADFDTANGSDFGDLTVTEQVNAGGLIDGATDTVVTDRTTGNVILVLDSVSAGGGFTIDAADFAISA